MTQQQINDTIIARIGLQLNDSIDLPKRIGMAFSNWFNAMIQPPAPPLPEEGQEQ